MAIKRCTVMAAGKGLVVLVVPLAINWAVWSTLVAPRQAAQQTRDDERTLAALEPELNRLVQESDRVLADAAPARAAVTDASSLLQEVQRLADWHRVQLSTLSAAAARRVSRSKRGEPSVAGNAAPVDVDATGSFGKLANWVSDVEALPGVLVDTWTLEPGEGGRSAHHLALTMSATLAGG